MSYGFKFFNDSSELVIDNELVKPWFAGRATFVSAEISSEIPGFSFTHGDGVTRNYVVYRITYTPATVSSGCFYISLPTDSIYNKSYHISNPFYSGSESIYVYAAVNTEYLPVAADIPEVYCFSFGQITTAGSGYGARLFNSSNQCVFDTTKSHLKIVPNALQSFDQFVTPNSGQSYLILQVVDYPSYFLPNLECNRLTRIDGSSFRRERYVSFFNQADGFLSSWLPKVSQETRTGSIPFADRYFNVSTKYPILVSGSVPHNILVSNALTYLPGYNGGTFPAASYEITISPVEIQERVLPSMLVTVNTTNVPSGGQLRYTLSGPGVTASDFVSGLTGTFAINNNTGSFNLLALEDTIYEQPESVTITITSLSGGALVGTPKVFSLKNTNFLELTTFPANVTSINEGEYFVVTLNSRESSTSPRIVNFTLSQVPSEEGAIDQPFDSQDWVEPVTLGSGSTVTANRFTLPANNTVPTASVVFQARNDFRADGKKKLRLTIDENPSLFVEFTVNDTSKEYSWSIAGPSTINEGIEYTYNVTTAAPTGTRAVIGLTSITGASEADIDKINGITYVPGDLYYVTTTNGSGSFTIKFKNDLLTEGSEAFTIFLDKDMAAPRTRLADLGFNITIVDTSVTPINWSFSKVTGNPTTALVREGTNMVVRIQSTNVPSYPHTIYYRIADGTGITDGDTNFITGAITAFSVTSPDQQVLFNINEDNLAEGTENFAITFYRTSDGSDIITALEWQIVDAISVTRDSGFVVEGGTQILTITPNYLDYPYTVYGQLSGGAGITASDFTSNSLLTETTLTSNTPVSLSVTTVEDYVNEGLFGEVVFFDMYSDPGRTNKIGNTISWTIGNPSYSFSKSFNSVNEGSNQVITISTNAILPKTFYGKMTGTNITSSDFSSPPNSTIFNWTITADGQSIGLTMANDLFTEGNETVSLSFYEDTNFTNQVGNSVTWQINDTSLTPPPSWSFTRNPNTATVDEGVSVTVTANSTYVPAYPTTIYYKLTGTGVSIEDFNLGALQGSWVITDNSEQITFLISADQLTEGTESVVVRFYSDSNYTTTIGNQLTFDIADASKTTWSFARSPSTGTINEGSDISFTATPSNLSQSHITIYYWVNGTGITAGDLVSASLEGSFLSSSGFTLNMKNDLLTEGLETAGITFYSDLNRTIPIGNTLSWNIGDTSLTPPSYTLSVVGNSVNEGSNFTFNIASANVLSYPFTAYYKLSGTGITVDDTDFDPLLGSVSVNGTSESFTINASIDQLTEGNETLTFSIYSDAARTVQLGSSVSIVLNDTSKTTWTFARTPATGSINEGGSISISATPSNPAQSAVTIYYWLNGTNILDPDFNPNGTLGSFNSSNGLTITMANDLLTEGTETVGITFYSDASRTIQIGNTLSWVVNDTSLNLPVYNVYFFTPPGSVSEGSTTNIGIDSSYITYNKTIYYKITGTGITALDTNFPLSGPFVLTSGFTFAQVNITADQLTEGNETLTVSLYSDEALTTQIGNTASINLIDSSTTTWSFSRSPSTGTINEGSTITFNTTPSNAAQGPITVYYSVSGINASDLTSGSLTGNFSSSSSASLTMVNDTTTEGAETATISFFSNSSRTTSIGSPISWTIGDTSLSPPSYSFSLSPTGTINEGTSVTITTTSANIPSYPSTIYYSISGSNITAADTSLGVTQGSISLASSSHNTVFTLSNDLLTEGNETLTFTFYSDSGRSVQIGSTLSLTINDTSTTTYTFDRAPVAGITINEGSSIQISATPSNPNSPIVLLYYTISGISAADLTSNSLTGSFASTAPPSFTMSNDSSTEGSETATISFYKDSGKTISAGNSVSWTIGDTSLSPPSYSFSRSPATVNEGSGLNVSWNFSNVPSFPITLYYTISGTGITAGDTSENTLQGSVSYPSASGTFSFNMTADLTTEGAETATATWYTNAARTIQAGNSFSWTIADTSVTPPPPIALSTLRVGYPTVGMTTIPRGSMFWLDVILSRANDSGADISVLIEYRVNSTGAWTPFETLVFPAFYNSKSTSLITNSATGPAATLNVRATSTSATGTLLLNLGW
jgi:hypothetical protein